MTRKNANMFICGPEVIKAATGQSATMEEIGSAAANAAVSGNVHFIAEDDTHALQIPRQLLSFLPANNIADPPHQPSEVVDMALDPEMSALIPEDPKAPFDVQIAAESPAGPPPVEAGSRAQRTALFGGAARHGG